LLLIVVIGCELGKLIPGLVVVLNRSVVTFNLVHFWDYRHVGFRWRFFWLRDFQRLLNVDFVSNRRQLGLSRWLALAFFAVFRLHVLAEVGEVVQRVA
jgi:hypothetical protein